MQNPMIEQLFTRYPSLLEVQDDIQAAFELLCGCFSSGGKLLLCGNGGSAADCDHIAGELMKGFLLKRLLSQEDQNKFSDAILAQNLQYGLPAVSLCAHGALTTAVANDTDASLIFAQQVWTYGRGGKDLLLAMSTSGNSSNVVYAAKTAKAMGLPVLSVTGRDGGALRQESTVCICLPASETYQIQELTLPLYHALCAAVEAYFFK